MEHTDEEFFYEIPGWGFIDTLAEWHDGHLVVYFQHGKTIEPEVMIALGEWVKKTKEVT